MNHPAASGRQRLRMTALLLAGALLCAACPDSKAPGSDISAAVKERRDNFRRMGDAYKAIKESIESGKPDAALVVRSARLIRDTGAGQPALFTPGSGAGSGAKTRARDAVWTEAALFARRQDEFLATSDALIAAAPADMSEGYEALTQACLACHEHFRERR